MQRRCAMLAISCAFATLAGCGQVLGETTGIRLRTSGPVLKADEAIIAARLREHTETLFPNYRFAPAEGGVVVIAKGMPPESDMRFLLRRRGVFTAGEAAGMRWLDGGDIADARVAIDPIRATVLNLRLHPEGAARLARLSAERSGAVLTVELDGEELVSARVSGPIDNGMLQVSLARSVAEASLIATILRSGALSFETVDVAIEKLP